MKISCLACSEPLAGDDLNVVKDLALCPKCGEVYVLSDLIQAQSARAVDVENAPRGAWYRDEFGGFTVGATTRHPIAFYLVPFMCVWSGFSLGGIYGTQIVKGEFNLIMSLFGIPFFLGTLLFGSLALMAVCGKVVVRVRDFEGEVFTGIGALGWRQRFDPSQVSSVRIESGIVGSPLSMGKNVGQSMTIVIDGPPKLRFASGLSEVRRDFLAGVLRQRLPLKGTDPFS